LLPVETCRGDQVIRGRLIYRFLAELRRRRFGGAAHADPDFKEPRLFDADDDGLDDRVRFELPPVNVPCQVAPKAFEELRMLSSGNSPRSVLELVFHFADLERLGLVDSATGDALIQVGDRLAAIRDLCGDLVQLVRDPPGAFVTEARPIGFGLGMLRPQRNFLLVTLEARRLGAGRVS
jgi:hypothetical protein